MAQPIQLTAPNEVSYLQPTGEQEILQKLECSD